MGETTDAKLDPGSAQFRLGDLRFVIELVVEAVEQEKGARDRLARRHGVQKSVITNKVDRIQAFVGVDLFTGPQRLTPTAAGRELAKRGPLFLSMVEDFVGMLHDAEAFERRSSQYSQGQVE